MSANQETPDVPAALPPRTVSEPNDYDIDSFLVNYVRQANKNEGSIDITIFVNGIIVSGRMIGGREYFKLYGKIMAADLKVDQPEIKPEVDFAAFYEKYGIDSYGATDEKRLENPVHIHMDNAKIFSPSGNCLMKAGVLWRGRLNQIDGWFIGAISLPE